MVGGCGTVGGVAAGGAGAAGALGSGRLGGGVAASTGGAVFLVAVGCTIGMDGGEGPGVSAAVGTDGGTGFGSAGGASDGAVVGDTPIAPDVEVRSTTN